MIDKGRVKGLRALRIPEGKKMKKERERGRDREGGRRRATRRTTGFFDLLLPPTTGKSRSNYFRYHSPLLYQCLPFCFSFCFFCLVLKVPLCVSGERNSKPRKWNKKIYVKTVVSLRVSRLLFRNGVSPRHVSCPVHESRLGYVKHERAAARAVRAIFRVFIHLTFRVPLYSCHPAGSGRVIRRLYKRP